TRLYRLGPTTALAARPPIARAAATAAMTRIGTKGFIVPPMMLGVPSAPIRSGRCDVCVSRGRYRLAQCRNEPIHPVTVAAIEPVGQELHDEAHEHRPGETVLHACPHDLRALDEPGESLAEGEVPAELVGEDLGVGPQRLLHGVGGVDRK